MSIPEAKGAAKVYRFKSAAMMVTADYHKQQIANCMQ
jgi:hypothetical protein